MAKATKDETQRRLTYILDGLTAGKKENEIYNEIKDQWQIGRNRFYLLVLRVRTEIANFIEFDRKFQGGLSISKLERLYKDTYSDKQYKTALSVLQEINKLLGLYYEDDLKKELTEIKELLEKKINE